MAKLQVHNLTGKKVGDVTLSDEIFAITPNQQAVYDSCLIYLSNRRQDTSKTKKRDEVSGGGRKPWRQKGTGRARQGSIRSPQWRGGGIVFGPSGEQNHKIKQNRKVRTLALKSALSQKLAENRIIAVDKCVLEEKKTKSVVAALKALEVAGKALFVIGEESSNEEFFYSTLNLPTVSISFYDELNVYEIVNNDYLIFTKEAVEALMEVLNG